MREWIDKFSDKLAVDGDEEGLMVMDGYDDCIIGIGQRFNDYAVVYDFDRVIAKLMADGLTRDEAVEFHEFNQLGAWVGDRTPIFLHTPIQEKADE